MADYPLSQLDFHLLRYFYVVAREGSIQAAARSLFMSQPPLSRQIRRLEEILGFPLFRRHNRGLVLTDKGMKVLEVVRPLLDYQAEAFRKLAAISGSAKKVAAGFTTAFEQGIFSGIRSRLEKRFGTLAEITRRESPRLVQDVRRGLLDIGFVALPADTCGLALKVLPYSEPLLAAVPGCWPEAAFENLALGRMGKRPLFWFNRSRNEFFYDQMQGFFKQIGYAPHVLEEPLEHDVLLARIADGEGMGLMAASFAAIKRENVAFVPIEESCAPRIELGAVYRTSQQVWDKVLNNIF